MKRDIANKRQKVEVKPAEQKVSCTKQFLLGSSDMINTASDQMRKLHAIFLEYLLEP